MLTTLAVLLLLPSLPVLGSSQSGAFEPVQAVYSHQEPNPYASSTTTKASSPTAASSGYLLYSFVVGGDGCGKSFGSRLYDMALAQHHARRLNVELVMARGEASLACDALPTARRNGSALPADRQPWHLFFQSLPEAPESADTENTIGTWPHAIGFHFNASAPDGWRGHRGGYYRESLRRLWRPMASVQIEVDGREVRSGFAPDTDVALHLRRPDEIRGDPGDADVRVYADAVRKIAAADARARRVFVVSDDPRQIRLVRDALADTSLQVVSDEAGTKARPAHGSAAEMTNDEKWEEAFRDLITIQILAKSRWLVGARASYVFRVGELLRPLGSDAQWSAAVNVQDSELFGKAEYADASEAQVFPARSEQPSPLPSQQQQATAASAKPVLSQQTRTEQHQQNPHQQQHQHPVQHAQPLKQQQERAAPVKAGAGAAEPDASKPGSTGRITSVSGTVSASGTACLTEVPLIALVMIVKDEARAIAATLASVKPYVDRWTILDTGSTDGTVALIKQALSDLPGELHEEEFVDFGTTRSRALQLAGQRAVFTLMLSGDELLLNGSALRRFCEERRDAIGPDEETYFVRVRLSSEEAPSSADLVYDMPRLTRAAAGWRYVGAVHETLVRSYGDQIVPTVRVPEAIISHSRNGPDQSARNLAMLERMREQEPNSTRTAFYYAMTLEDLGRYEDAYSAFQKRIEMAGWRGEVYEAMYRKARCAANLPGFPWSSVQQMYLDAFAYAPWRAEPLYAVALHWQAKGEHHLAYIFAKRAAELPNPTANGDSGQDLFVQGPIYEHLVHDVLSVSAYYVGEHEVGEAAVRRALAAQPDNERFLTNLAFFEQRKSQPAA